LSSDGAMPETAALKDCGSWHAALEYGKYVDERTHLYLMSYTSDE